MTADSSGTEQIANALQAADSLVSTLKEACTGLENGREVSLLAELLSDAQRIRNRLKRLTQAKGTE